MRAVRDNGPYLISIIIVKSPPYPVFILIRILIRPESPSLSYRKAAQPCVQELGLLSAIY